MEGKRRHAQDRLNPGIVWGLMLSCLLSGGMLRDAAYLLKTPPAVYFQFSARLWRYTIHCGRFPRDGAWGRQRTFPTRRKIAEGERVSSPCLLFQMGAASFLCNFRDIVLFARLGGGGEGIFHRLGLSAVFFCIIIEVQ